MADELPPGMDLALVRRSLELELVPGMGAMQRWFTFLQRHNLWDAVTSEAGQHLGKIEYQFDVNAKACFSVSHDGRAVTWSVRIVPEIPKEMPDGDNSAG